MSSSSNGVGETPGSSNAVTTGTGTGSGETTPVTVSSNEGVGRADGARKGGVLRWLLGMLGIVIGLL